MAPYKVSECPRCGAPIYAVANPDDLSIVPKTVFSCDCHKFLQLPDPMPWSLGNIPYQTTPMIPYLAPAGQTIPLNPPIPDMVICHGPVSTPTTGTITATFGTGGYGVYSDQ